MRRENEPPMYDETADGVDEANRPVFVCTVSAFGLTASASAKSKREAKHMCAFNLLTELKKSEQFQTELMEIPQLPAAIVETEQTLHGDPISALLDLCVQRDWPIASFTLMKAGGASHAPSFTIECRVATIARCASSSTKKAAKHLAAEAMLAVINTISATPKNLQQIVSPEDTDQRIQTYRELKNSGVKPETFGVKLGDRHKYFATKFSPVCRTAVLDILTKLNETSAEKLSLICKEMKLDYKVFPLNDAPLTWVFELKCDYDCVLAYPKDVLYETVLSYIKSMMF